MPELTVNDNVQKPLDLTAVGYVAAFVINNIFANIIGVIFASKIYPVQKLQIVIY